MTKEEAQSLERAALTAYTLNGIGIDVGCGDSKFEGNNIIGIDKYHPKANRIFDFEAMPIREQLDFVIMSHYLRYTRDVMLNLKKAIQFLAPGGKLLIVEMEVRDPNAPSYYNFPEMEGLLLLFEDWVHIDFKGPALKGFSYYYICTRKESYVNPIPE